MARQNLTNREGTEQATLFSWAAMMQNRYPELLMMYHIPNGGKRSATEAARFKAEGVKAGVPDIHLPVARQGYHSLYIEMKRTKGGTVSEYQKQWIQLLRNEGHRVEVCYGWEEAKAVLQDYLGEGRDLFAD